MKRKNVENDEMLRKSVEKRILIFSTAFAQLYFNFKEEADVDLNEWFLDKNLC